MITEYKCRAEIKCGRRGCAVTHVYECIGFPQMTMPDLDVRAFGWHMLNGVPLCSTACLQVVVAAIVTREQEGTAG